MEYILYCDESSDKGTNFGDFFGGCLVASSDIKAIVDEFEELNKRLNLGAELKWTKVTAPYLEKYVAVVTLFFRFIREGKIKMRVMFRSMSDTQPRSERHQSDEKYTKLYYQFIKHAFGFMYAPDTVKPYYLRVYLDKLPDTDAHCERFKQFLLDMPHSNDFADSGLHIRSGDIAEVDSKRHILLQCVDIVMGAMFFRLNGLHLQKPEGSTRRGNRTIAKEKLYKHINSLIREIRPGFNIGVSTGINSDKTEHWNMPYAHWKFIPKTDNAPHSLHKYLAYKT